MSVITFIEKNIIGDKYINVFKMADESTNEIETTKEDYEQLATPEHINPTIDGGEWLSSHSQRKLDTPSGDLGDGEYFADGDAYIANHNGSQVNLTAEEATNGVEQSVIEERILNF